jgi:glycosyltransferase involved in cell wall biosynthesis
VTRAITARNLIGEQFKFMRRQGYEVYLITDPNCDAFRELSASSDVKCISVQFQREISPLRDAGSLIAVTWQIWRLRPDVVVASTPKAGLIGLVAATLLGVRTRIYVLRGLRLETIKGLKKTLLLQMEWLAAHCSHKVVCVSQSLRREYVRLRLCPKKKTVVLANGSSNGVDIARFEQHASDIRTIERMKEELGLSANSCVAGFVGRIVRDKGIIELWNAFKCAAEHCSELSLLIVGGYELDELIASSLRTEINRHRRVAVVEWCDPARYYAVMDFVVLPSFREGFPNVVLEAAACRRPTIGFSTTGVVDAIVDGETGSIVPVGDVNALATTMQYYARNPEVVRRYGANARARVERDFRPETIWQELSRIFEMNDQGRAWA